MKCSVCCSPASNVWEIASGIIPNHYHKELKKEKKSSQGIFFCETCQTLENVHSFSEEDLFSNYVYRTPNTSMDEEIANYLATFINKNNIEKVVEVGHSYDPSKEPLSLSPPVPQWNERKWERGT